MNPAVIENMVPIFIMLGMFLLIFGVAYMRSRENMALIDRGINPRQENPRPRYFNSLRYGLLLLGVGFGLIASYIIDVLVLGHKEIMEKVVNGDSTYWSTVQDTREPIIYFSLIAIGGGIGLYLAYRAEHKEWKQKQIN